MPRTASRYNLDFEFNIFGISLRHRHIVHSATNEAESFVTFANTNRGSISLDPRLFDYPERHIRHLPGGESYTVALNQTSTFIREVIQREAVRRNPNIFGDLDYIRDVYEGNYLGVFYGDTQPSAVGRYEYKVSVKDEPKTDRAVTKRSGFKKFIQAHNL